MLTLNFIDINRTEMYQLVKNLSQHIVRGINRTRREIKYNMCQYTFLLDLYYIKLFSILPMVKPID